METIKKINGLTFLEFMQGFKGKRIFNKHEQEVPKFVLFWSRKTIKEIKENYKFVDRK